jgi:PIN domain nuclease of toxin-antitoxin system
VRLLLDTCTFLWMVSEPVRLSPAAIGAIVDPDNEVLLSAVSAWEIAVKHELGKLALDRPPERYVPEERARHGVEALALDDEATLHLHRLPAVHRDPFDRMLVCQALSGGLTIVTPDPRIARYPARVLW